jgi:hypothetical protein
MGRPPIGKQTMTGAERMRRHRARFRHDEPMTKQDDKPVTKPVTEPSAPAQPGLCAACVEALVQEYENHILVLREALANECYQHDATRRLYHRALTALEHLAVKQGERAPKPNGPTTSRRRQATEPVRHSRPLPGAPFPKFAARKRYEAQSPHHVRTKPNQHVCC